MTGRVLGVMALLAVVGAGGAVWLVVRDQHGRSRMSSVRVLRRLTTVSALVVLATVVFLRPWYWDLAAAAVVIATFLSLQAMVRSLAHRSSPASWGAIARALVSVVLASGLVTLAGAAAVIDGAAVAGGKAVLAPHDRQVLAHPVLYQVFWGSAWDDHGGVPALTEAAAFQRSLPGSQWASAVVGAGFGVGSLSSGGCWVDPGNAASPSAASSTSSGAFPLELGRVFDGHTHLVPCPGFTATRAPRTLPPDAVVALWLDPDVRYELGGVSAHGAVPWPGRADGLAAAGLTGGFVHWGQGSCAHSPACASVPSFASPTFALSHELVEAVTNPFGHGWYADVPLRWAARYFLSHGPTSLLSIAPAFEGEVADLCEPGQPAARDHGRIATLGPQRMPVAAFYRPAVGCVA